MRLQKLSAVISGLLFAGTTMASGTAMGSDKPILPTGQGIADEQDLQSLGFSALGAYIDDLPQGSIWVSEEADSAAPAFSLQAPASAAVEDGRLLQPLQFRGFNNYASFIDRIEISVHAASDVDLVTPLARFDVPVAHVVEGQWLPEQVDGIHFAEGEELIYIARVHGRDGLFDELHPERIRLVSAADQAAGLQQLRDQIRGLPEEDTLDDIQLQSRLASEQSYGRNQLRVQNVEVRASRVRLYGQGLPPRSRVTVNGRHYPVDEEGGFVAEFLEPVGVHEYEVRLESSGGEPVVRKVQVEVTGRKLFAMGIADFTLSEHGNSGALPSLGGNRQSEGFPNEGRLAFYLKGRFANRYTVTAQADTGQRELDELFEGFLDADPRDIFRRLDPDQYYPTYGDDSLVYRDIDTQGKFYLRMDWDRNQALWGNYSTGFASGEYAHYQRALYGAALDWRSRAIHPLGEPRSQLRVFASEAQTAPGHTQFLGTGGSLYYLRHTDVLPGSETVSLEVRERGSGRTESQIILQRGVDYEIDELQGRLILTRPLAQITRENLRTLTRDTPLDGYEQILLVDYEYVPAGGFKPDEMTLGVRGRQWVGDHVAVGGTWVEESRQGDDYRLQGVDMTLQAGRGTYLRMEHSRTESTSAPVYRSDNGGLDFFRLNEVTGRRSGEATAVDARVNLKELGWTQRPWTVAAWYRDREADFSINRRDTGRDLQETGVEFQGELRDGLTLYGRHSQTESGPARLRQTQLTSDWRIGTDTRLGAELRQVQERGVGVDSSALLAAVNWRQRLSPRWDWHVTGQLTVDDDDGRYANNNLVVVGARHLWPNQSSLGLEVGSGSRGEMARADLDYRIGSGHNVYAGYTYSTDRTTLSPLSRNGNNGWTFGQRWRLTNQTTVFSESQYLKDIRRDEAGLVHTLGWDFMPRPGWNLGMTVTSGELDAAAGTVERRALSVFGGKTGPDMQWNSKLELRRDRGAEHRDQWLTTNRLHYRISPDWRLALRLNYADTEDARNPLVDARLVESNLGFAWRPHDSTRWAAFGRYTYLYDRASVGQEGGARFDQRSHVISLEGIRQINDNWEVAAKLARRDGDFRLSRGQGPWLDGRMDFAALQLRYHWRWQWEALLEHRWQKVPEGGKRDGWLLGVERRLGENFKVGVGYNFTRFSDDLTNLEPDHKGFFLNLSGYY